MEDILKRSQDNQDQMSSRVTALLAGSSLTTTAGVRIDRRDTIDQIDYTAVGEQILFFQDLILVFTILYVGICLVHDLQSRFVRLLNPGAHNNCPFLFLFFYPNVLANSPSFAEQLRFCFSHSVEIIDN